MDADSTQKPLSLILDEIEERANKATEGAWEHCSGGSPFSPAHRIVCGHAVLLYVESEHLNADANFNFVASARTDVPALVKALRRATQALELLNDGSSTRSDISIRIELEQITTILNQGRSVGDNKGSAA